MHRTIFVGLFLWLVPLTALAKNRVLVISLDGMRPEFSHSSQWEAPTLQRLAREGASAASMTPVFPTVTYVNHTTLITGVRPDHHGIYGNEQFDPKTGPLKTWNWDANLIKVPTLFNLAHKAGLVTASFSWPVTVGAPVDYLMPEIFRVEGGAETTEQLLRKDSTPGLLDEAEKLSPGPFPEKYDQIDRFMTRILVQTWQKHRPRMAFLHLVAVDSAQHRHGTDAPEVHQALQELDSDLAAVIAAVDPKDTTVIVLGDHGFQIVHQRVSLNHMFWEHGWLHLKQPGQDAVAGWTVYAQTHGGSATVFCRDPALAPQVLELLREHAGAAYEVVDRDELKKLGTLPENMLGPAPAPRVICAVSARPGYMLAWQPTHPFSEPVEPALGSHGHLPEYVPTGLVLWGAGVKPGQDLGDIVNLDVAPTIAKLLGLSTRGMQGEPLKFQH
jgi:predicted AlkP superfamily pyrophosphatase or phosphodiesterase